MGKRAPSPGALERASKVARIDEDTKRETYRSHTREAFEERRILGQLSAASRTLLALDEKAGIQVGYLNVAAAMICRRADFAVTLIQFNILSLNPQEPETIPPEMLEVLSAAFVVDDEPIAVVNSGTQESERERLRKQMEMDALQPLETLSPDGDSDGDDSREVPKKNTLIPWSLSRETMDEVREFLRLNVSALIFYLGCGNWIPHDLLLFRTNTGSRQTPTSPQVSARKVSLLLLVRGAVQ